MGLKNSKNSGNVPLKSSLCKGRNKMPEEIHIKQ